MTEAVEYSFSIPYVLPSINEQQRMHWAGRARIKQRCLEYLMEARSLARKEKRAWPKDLREFALRLERWSVRDLDEDNLVASHKSLIDAMKRDGGLGLILDDSPKHMLVLKVTQSRTNKARTRTVITLVPK